ncbi:MAG: type IX secretion system membrane protein PorP/SprF [Bacteroidales bacterium]|nr:MAG: type IX secretion system membrane protein PorP/SprF [Bacteroidales bacterium]
MKYILYIALIIVTLNAGGQDRSVLYSQYLYNRLAITPAFAGGNDALTVSISTRNQWIGHTGAPKTHTLSSHIPLKNTKVALGLLLSNETIGARNYTSTFFNYAYRINLSQGKLSLGLRAGIMTGNLDISDMAEDPVYNNETTNYLLPNFGIGGYYYTDRLFVGASIPLLLGYKNGENNSRLKPYHSLKTYSYYIISGYTYNISSNWQIQPSFLLNYEMSLSYNLDISLSTIYRNILRGGATYRTNKSVVFLFDYKFTYQFRAGFAYDYGFGEINRYNNSAFELFLQYIFGYKVQVPSLRDF